ncbi:glycosyltransferase family 2 protein, partial [Staphylococcus aureus]
QLFYDAFAEMETILNRQHLNIKDYLTEDKYEKVYQRLSQSDKEKAVKLSEILVKGERAPRYVSNGLVNFVLPETLQEIAPLTEEFFAVYSGTE